MTILFATTDYVKKGQPTTGLPAYLYRVSQALISMGHTPVILLTGREDSYKRKDGVEIYTISPPEKDFKEPCMNYLYRSFTRAWLVNKKIKEIVKKRTIDIIQFTSLNGLAMFYSGKVPAVLRLSSYTKTYYQTYATFDKKLVNVMSFVERISAKRCNALFAPCQITADAFGADCHRKTYVIETPFVNDVKKYDNSLYEKELKDKKYFLFFGSLYTEKGILVIGEILEELLDKYPEHYFVFAGRKMSINGKNAADIIKRCGGKHKNRVIVYDAMPHERLYPIIKNAELVTLPSLMDNFPNSCIEAMYFSKIVIGTDGASFEQLITDGKNGFLCKPGDAGSLMKKIDYAMSMSVEEKRRIQENARKRIALLKPETAVKELVAFYNKVINTIR